MLLVSDAASPTRSARGRWRPTATTRSASPGSSLTDHPGGLDGARRERRQTKVYGQIDPALTYVATGFQFTDTEASVLTGDLARAGGESLLASYAISQGTLAADSDYTISFTGSSLTITPATLDDDGRRRRTKMYGQIDPALTYVATGLPVQRHRGVGADGCLARTAGEHAASYAISQGTLAADSDYTISFTGSSLTITPATLVAVVIGDPTKVYDGNTSAILTSTNFSITGLVGSDSVAVTQTAGIYNSQHVATANTVTAALSSGNFTLGFGTFASDYLLPASASGPGHVTKANATIVVTPYSVTYNAHARIATGTVTGVDAGMAALGGTLSLTGTTHTSAGDYPSDAWSFSGGSNYNDASGTIHDFISKAALTVAANNASRFYGAANPTFTASYSGFATGDTFAGSVTGTPSLTTLATTGSPVGSYSINAAQGTLAASNYTFTFIKGTLTVTALAGSVLVLNGSASGAVTVSGNASINIPGNLVVDSSSVTAISASGNAQIRAAGIQVVGNVQKSGNATISAYTSGTAAVADPFGGLPAPTIPSYGAAISASFSGNSTATISQGAYSQIVVSGNAKLTLNGGVYVVGTGGVSVSGNGSLVCNNVTFIIQGGGFVVSGNASISGNNVLIYNGISGNSMGGITLSGNGTFKLNAATSGPDANILIDQPLSNTRALSISGNAMFGITGTIHAPSAQLAMSGNGSLQNPLIIATLSLSGNVTLSQTADGSDFNSDLSAGADTLLAGNQSVYINDSSGFLTASERGRIHDAIDGLNLLLVPYAVAITEVLDPAQANLVIDVGLTSAAGGAADGVLGSETTTETASEITIVQGWNWYAGSDPTAIGSDQYDFQTVVTHELGHALGLGHNSDVSSVMHASLATGTIRRAMTIVDLNIPDPPDGHSDRLLADGFQKFTTTESLSRSVSVNRNAGLSSVLPKGLAVARVATSVTVPGAITFSSFKGARASGRWSVLSDQSPVVGRQLKIGGGQRVPLQLGAIDSALPAATLALGLSKRLRPVLRV